MSHPHLTPPVTAHDRAQGPADASVTLVEYGDFECSYCGLAYPIVKAAQQAMGPSLRFVFRNFPLREAHPYAERAAEAAEAAAAQGQFWAMHDVLYEHQHALDDEDLVAYAGALGLEVDRFVREMTAGAYAEPVRAEFLGGVRSGVNGTPTFFINGRRYDGDWRDTEAFVTALAQAAEGAATPHAAGSRDAAA